MLSRIKMAPLVQTIDYKYILPGLSSLPLPLGKFLCYARGFLFFGLDHEWRNFALGKKFIRRNTYLAMQDIMPKSRSSKHIYATMLRYVHNSREEWQACLFRKKIMRKIMQKSRIEGLSRLEQLNSQGRGVVLVSCHLDSFCMGMVLLGMNGIKMNCVNTAMIEDKRIHPEVRAFFQRKYRVMEMHMGGKMEYHETNMAFFYRALERGETVTLMGDIPGNKSTVHIPFLGRRFRLPLGAWHLARKTNSLIGGYICVYEEVGKYKVVILPPEEIDPADPEKSLRPVYEFLEHWIRKMPQRWVSADLLPGFPL